MSKQNNSNLLIGAVGITALAIYSLQSKSTPGSTKGNIAYKGTIDFIKKNLPYARAVEKSMNVPEVVNLTIAAVESGWGKHAIKNNLHGIKADSKWHGDYSLVKTPECFPNANKKLHVQTLSIVAPNGYGSFAACTKKGDYTYWINDKFRAYSSPAGSFIDFGNFLHEHYKGAFKQTNKEDFGRYVLSHGYATAAYVDTFLDLVKKVQGIIDGL